MGTNPDSIAQREWSNLMSRRDSPVGVTSHAPKLMSQDADTGCKDDVITLACTVDNIVGRVPAALALLGRHNIDTCCGGRSSLGEAVAHAHANERAVLADLLAAQLDAPSGALSAASTAKPAASTCGCGCR